MRALVGLVVISAALLGALPLAAGHDDDTVIIVRGGHHRGHYGAPYWVDASYCHVHHVYHHHPRGRAYGYWRNHGSGFYRGYTRYRYGYPRHRRGRVTVSVSIPF